MLGDTSHTHTYTADSLLYKITCMPRWEAVLDFLSILKAWLPFGLFNSLQKLVNSSVIIWARESRFARVEALVQNIGDVLLTSVVKELTLPTISQDNCLFWL